MKIKDEFTNFPTQAKLSKCRTLDLSGNPLSLQAFDTLAAFLTQNIVIEHLGLSIFIIIFFSLVSYYPSQYPFILRIQNCSTNPKKALVILQTMNSNYIQAKTSLISLA